VQIVSELLARAESVELLERLAGRVRSLRRSLALTRTELARRSGLSERFLARVESGQGNISVVRLAALARALETSAERLVRVDDAPAALIVLVGLRGAGKSTVGPLLARLLGRPFVEIDARIVETAGLSLEQLFELHGEGYYRRLEREILGALIARGEPIVVAVAGGVINDATTWRMLRDRTCLVWLHATADDHWNRVISQGDRRPMADNPAAREELHGLLGARSAVYAEAALDVDTSAGSPESIAASLAARLRAWNADGRTRS